FFYPYVDHRDLHSFPTRRSSDLDDIYRRMEKNYGTELAFFAEDAQIHLLCITTFTRSATGNLQADTQSLMTVDAQWLPFENRERSEEHTSELQSRENLVCRLLLE